MPQNDYNQSRQEFEQLRAKLYQSFNYRRDTLMDLADMASTKSINPAFLTPKAIGKAKKPTVSRFEPGVCPCCHTTVCGESFCRHQNQLDWAQKAIYLA